MSTLEIKVENRVLSIDCDRARKTELDYEKIDLDTLQEGKVYQSYVTKKKKEDANAVLYFEKLEGFDQIISDEMQLEKYLLVFSQGSNVKYCIGDPEKILKKVLKLHVRVLRLKLTKRKLALLVLGYYTNKYSNLELGKQCVRISETVSAPINFKVLPKQVGKLKLLRPKFFHSVSVPMDKIVEGVATINSNLLAEIEVNGIKVPYGMPKKKRGVKVSRRYFAPLGKAIVNDLMISVRGNARGNLTMVMRPLDEFEKTSTYRFWESNFISKCLYNLGKIVRKYNKKPVNLYFEKETMKAEEGTYDVFLKAVNESTSDNYYIIDPSAEIYESIKGQKNVVAKYSKKYYWLLYRATSVITTEAPAHVNILRSANKYIRLRLVEYKFVFLQHGVTYMKCHGPMSAFVAGREAEPTYMFVGSKKERDVVVDMLKLPEENVLVTGLPIFSTIDYKQITQSSEDYVTIMLTFKPYEERLDDFQNSRYYQAILDLYAIISKYVPEEKILIVAHPRIEYLLSTTELKDRMWKQSVSDVLKISKLMVTDYSSVAYNSFYQGAGVIFYQEDIEEYQAICGQLIPRDDEYIGKRAFSLEEFDKAMQEVTADGHVILEKARTKEFEDNYTSINKYHDGKNVDRIYEKLKELKLV